MNPGTTLYSPAILGQAFALGAYPLSDDLTLRATRRGRVCGSEVTIGYDPDDLGKIGAQVAACAVGQAAAGVMVSSPMALAADAVADGLQQIDAWLHGSGDLPCWEGFGILEAALAHPGRHAAIRLPWQAALAALSKRQPSR